MQILIKVRGREYTFDSDEEATTFANQCKKYGVYIDAYKRMNAQSASSAIADLYSATGIDISK